MKIDFVIIWVDGNDQNWITQKNSYSNKESSQVDSSIARYRDWENLQYWFRGVEKFAPWVNKIHFVTWGHLPQWLNTNHPKLNIIKHEDYIPEKYLPTFSSHTIELNLHRIKGLSEHFVYFNDDMFLIDYVKENIFFKNDLPCDSAILNVHCYDLELMNILAPFIDVGIVNKYFDIHNVIHESFHKWFSLCYGKYNIRNIILAQCPRFPGFLQQHLPTSFCKSTFHELWDLESKVLDETCQHKFRHKLDVNQWLFKEWQLVTGRFEPRRVNIGKSFVVSNMGQIIKYINNQTGKMICINDENILENVFIQSKDILNQSFHTILPEKSSYEL